MPLLHFTSSLYRSNPTLDQAIQKLDELLSLGLDSEVQPNVLLFTNHLLLAGEPLTSDYGVVQNVNLQLVMIIFLCVLISATTLYNSKKSY